MEANKQQLELDMEQWARSKLGKEYVKAVSCHLAYLTYFTVFHMNSPEGRKKALATCSSHLSVVSLYFGPAMVIYMTPGSSLPADVDPYLSSILVQKFC